MKWSSEQQIAPIEGQFDGSGVCEDIYNFSGPSIIKGQELLF